ncbi:MmcQ/YjbR family DNA-binding protein [Flavobacterium litorale]|uniref:MmcQ/YjbR family DNA-binding protein n=1 Tax=Flavobacterium litorale TaxID=2856519 RepID=A0ABX8VFF5_9FLAO|nr:MmcQ/YjbR family DNA-binding protein [Flavobacterium litorale]QYJ69341.1 MmcQ/YjbR family DNA-binding protein [Flavobacterium litorale]
MNIQQFYEYCLAKKGVTEHFPFDDDVLVFKVGNKMFALSSVKSWEKEEAAINLKCDPERALELRAEYEGVQPGYHMSKQHWNTVSVHSDVPLSLLKELIDHSYELIFKSLTKKLQAEVLASE